MTEQSAILKFWETVKHFKPSEFDSPDETGSGFNISMELIKIIDQIRQETGIAMKINSGYRTKQHNLEVGGKPDSAHTQGFAVDILVLSSQDRFTLIKKALDKGITRIGIGSTFLHLDLDYSKPQSVCWLYPTGSGG